MSHETAYNRNNPFSATITTNRNLNKPGSNKDTRHIEINLAGSGITYHPGDSLGVKPHNKPAHTDELIALLNINPLAPSPLNPALSTREDLLHTYTLNRVGKKFIKALADKLATTQPNHPTIQLAANPEQLDEYIHTRDYVDVMLEHPGTTFTDAEFFDTLPKANPRLYSIASSQAKHPGEVHLTVAVVQYETHGREKFGLCSGCLADKNPGDTIPVYVQPSRHFHLPEKGDTDMIMVGPGTGIAPFRAFLEQREINGDKGRNWLFFGDQKRATDFMYEEEFLDYQQRGILTQLDTAFSRDQAHKIYVQDRIRENGKQLWDWLQNGAYFYVCGDAKRMAKDVHQALIDIAREHGGKTEPEASEYINTTLTKTEKRYLKDVY